MKIKLSICMVAALVTGTDCLGGIPEAPLILYGKVTQTIGPTDIRRTTGTITVTVLPPMGDPVTVSTDLYDINQQFSYALELPCESVIPPMANVSSNTLMLTPMPLPYMFIEVKIDDDYPQILDAAVAICHCYHCHHRGYDNTYHRPR